MSARKLRPKHRMVKPMHPMIFETKLAALKPIFDSFEDSESRLLPFFQINETIDWSDILGRYWTRDEEIVLNWMRLMWEGHSDIKPNLIGEVWPMDFRLREAVIFALAADAYSTHLLSYSAEEWRAIKTQGVSSD